MPTWAGPPLLILRGFKFSEKFICHITIYNTMYPKINLKLLIYKSIGDILSLLKLWLLIGLILVNGNRNDQFQ